MRTTSAAWAAALAVMTLNGATSAQAAPFRSEEEQIRALPRMVRRQITNGTLPLFGTGPSNPGSEPPATTSQASQNDGGFLGLPPLPTLLTTTTTRVVTVDESQPSETPTSDTSSPSVSPSALLPPLVIFPTSSPASSPAPSDNSSPSATSSAGAAQNTGLLPTLFPTPSSTDASTSATASTGGLLPDLTLLPVPVTSSAQPSVTASASSFSFLVGVSTVIESSTASATPSSPLLGLTLPITLLPTTTAATSTAVATESVTPASTTPAISIPLSIPPLSSIIPSLSASLPITESVTPTISATPTASVSDVASTTASAVVSETGSAIVSQSFTLSTSGISVTPVPVSSTAVSVPVVSESAAASVTASASISAPVTASVPPVVSVSATASGNVTEVVSTRPATSEPAPITTSAPVPSAVVSVVPTGTNTQTTLAVSTGIVFATSATETGSLATASTQSAVATAFPTGMPQLIQPPGGQPTTSPSNVLIQVGFTYALNYPFVAGNTVAVNQIFAFLPRGISYGLDLDANDVKMNALIPYNTSASMGYITTLAQAYIPSDKVNQMQLALQKPTSNLYQNPDSSVHTLMSLINPTLPLFPGATVDDSGSGTNNQGVQTSSPKTDAAPIGGDAGSSSPVKGTSVGIGVGAVAGAALYAAAMVFVARRYRQKKRGHQRSPSVQYSRAPNMSERGSGGGMGSFFMSGANGRQSGTTRAPGSRNSETSSNGRSVRDAGISAPVTSANSLGW